jgi:putative proteasome-type protease
MTYCLGINLKDGLVFASDSRTNAGVDHIATFRKMSIFEKPGQRCMFLLSAGNLGTSQAVVTYLTRNLGNKSSSIDLYGAKNMYDAAELIGDVLREVTNKHGEHVRAAGADPGSDFLFGGQIKGGQHRLFHIYSAGNFIESSPETPCLQIGETKYGKPILDRVITHDLAIENAVKVTFLSFDATMRSNLSVGLPIDIATYRTDKLKVDRHVVVTESDQFHADLRRRYNSGLLELFKSLPSPSWLD